MELVFAILAFVVVSVIADAFEGKKKKEQQAELPGQKAKVKAGAQEKRPEIMIPPIKGAPPVQTDMQMVYHEPEPVLKERPVEKKKEPESVLYQPLKIEEKPMNTVNIQPETMLTAFAYAQILQPPKAYQYMARRGDGNNHKS